MSVPPPGDSGLGEPVASVADAPTCASVGVSEEATSLATSNQKSTESAAPTTLETNAERDSTLLASPAVATTVQLRSAALSTPSPATSKFYSPKAPGPRSAQYLNILVAGESGLGKTTFSHTFFQIERPTEGSSSAGIREATTRIEPIRVTHQTALGTDFHVALYDSVGWGNCSPNPDVSIDRIESFILQKFDEHKRSAGGIARGDARLHCCFYFIAPHRLKDIDIEFMRRVSEHLLVIPIIAKADAMTVSELGAFKQKIYEQLQTAQIQTYPQQGDAQQRIFAVIGSESLARVWQCPRACCVRSLELRELFGRGREYRWGTAIVDNPEHSDIAVLGHLVIARYNDLQAAADEKYSHWHRNHWRVAFCAWRTRALHQLQLRAVLATSILCLLVVFLVALALFQGVSSMESSLRSCHAQLRGAASDVRKVQDEKLALESELHQLRGEVSSLHQRLEAEKHASSLLQEGRGEESSWFLQALIAIVAVWVATSVCCFHVGRKKGEAAKRKWF